jgi:hypothetical protein
MTRSTGQRSRRQPATDENLFDVLASRSDLVGECLVYVAQPSDPRPRISYYGRMERAYVAVYMYVHGGVVHNVLHTCNNSRCWNPMHLYDGTKRHNALDAIADGVHVSYSDERHGNARFSDDDVRAMRALYANGMRIAAIARMYDTDRGTMCKIVHMKSRVA